MESSTTSPFSRTRSQSVNSSQPPPDAACHSYLGNSSQELYSRNLLEFGKTYEILILPLPDIVVFPGETVPLRIQNREFILKLQEILRGATTPSSLKSDGFACHIGILRLTNRSSLEKIGTTVEVRSTHGQTTLDDEELIVTAKGRYRFQLNHIQRLPPNPVTNQPSSVLIGHVQILPEPLLLPKQSPRRLQQAIPPEIYRAYSPLVLAKRAYLLYQQCFQSSATAAAPPRNTSSTGDTTVESSSLLLQRYGYHDQIGKYGAELDPIGFSFSLCTNLPIPSPDLQQLLNCKDLIDRLLLAIHYLQRSLTQQAAIACRVCNQIICHQSDLFNVPGAEGCAGAYVNSYGAVHQTLTFRQLDRNVMIEFTGRPSIEDSWFPGYAWTIIHCQRCFNHLGWRFTRVSDDEGEAEDANSRESEDEEEEDYPSQNRRRSAPSSSNHPLARQQRRRIFMPNLQTFTNNNNNINNSTTNSSNSNDNTARSLTSSSAFITRLLLRLSSANTITNSTNTDQTAVAVESSSREEENIERERDEMIAEIQEFMNRIEAAASAEEEEEDDDDDEVEDDGPHSQSSSDNSHSNSHSNDHNREEADEIEAMDNLNDDNENEEEEEEQSYHTAPMSSSVTSVSAPDLPFLDDEAMDREDNNEDITNPNTVSAEFEVNPENITVVDTNDSSRLDPTIETSNDLNNPVIIREFWGLRRSALRESSSAVQL